MRRWGVLGATILVAALSVGPARAALLPIGAGQQPQRVGGVLGVSSGVLTFSGTVTAPTPLPMVSDPEPQVCASAAGCQEWTLAVGTPDPFLASIHTVAPPGSPAFDPNDGLNLYVYDPAGNQAGSSAGVGSNGQAVAITPPAGTGPGHQVVYTLVVTVTYALDNPVHFNGEARVMAGSTWTQPTCATTTPCPVLPTLEALPPSDFHVTGLPPAPSTPLGFPFPVDAPTPTSCYAEETANTGATRCLRFTSDVRDTGTGALQLSWDWVAAGAPPQAGFAPGQCHATQIVEMSDGTTTSRPAGDCEFHLQHGHFHYDNLVKFAMYPVVNGVRQTTAVNTGLKESFCLADDDYFGFGTAGPNGPRGFSGQPGCSAPATVGSAGAYGLMGISSGWGDVYTWDTPDQFIDISHVADGTYDVVSAVNPNGVLDTTTGGPGPCSATRVTLTGSTVTVVASYDSTPCP